MPGDDKTTCEPTRKSGFLKIAVGFAVAFFVISFPVDWIWDRIDGSTFDARKVATDGACTGVIAGILFAWWMTRKTRAR